MSASIIDSPQLSGPGKKARLSGNNFTPRPISANELMLGVQRDFHEKGRPKRLH
jgi:hypothetical protein